MINYSGVSRLLLFLSLISLNGCLKYESNNQNHAEIQAQDVQEPTVGMPLAPAPEQAPIPVGPIGVPVNSFVPIATAIPSFFEPHRNHGFVSVRY